MSLEGYFICPLFLGHGVRMYRSIEMYKSKKYLNDNDVTLSEKEQKVNIYRSENILPQWHFLQL